MIICSPQLGLSPESNLGGEVYDREMLKGLDNLGVQTLIILPFGKKHPPFKNALIYNLPVPFVYPPWLFNILIFPYLVFLYQRHRFTILRVHNPYFVGFAAVLIKKLHPKVKLIASYLHLEQNNKLYDLTDRLLLPHFDRITTISNFTKEDITSSYAVNPDLITVIPCGVENKYQPKKKNFNLLEKFGLPNKKVLLYLGQLIERKNIPFLFKVIKKLPNNYVLLICGTGPQSVYLKKIVSEQKLNHRVYFTGKILESEKVDYYNLADVFVSPSLKEGFGMVVFEALSCGLKVVACNLPVFDDVKNLNLITLPLDPSRWTTEIPRHLKKTKTGKIDYSWENSAKKLYELYKLNQT